jgi:hypothetical protein
MGSLSGWLMESVSETLRLGRFAGRLPIQAPIAKEIDRQPRNTVNKALPRAVKAARVCS